MNDREKKIAPLCDGIRTSGEIAALAGDNEKYVQRVMLKYDLPRLKQSPRTGSNNPAFVSGCVIDNDGYCIVSAPYGHPYARVRHDRNFGVIYKHRLMMEDKIQRYLEPSEVVDHIDGLRLHNSPDNLRLFSCNAEHLKATISGQIPRWSKKGKAVLGTKLHQREDSSPIHTYRQMKRNGDARLRQILLALIQFGGDSPHLLGTHFHTKKAGISDLSRSNLERELEMLLSRYE